MKTQAKATRPRLTPTQEKVLLWIGEFLAANLRPPTVREVGAAFDFRSTNAVTCHLTPLRRKGYLEILPDKSRGLVPAGLPVAEIGRLVRAHVAALAAEGRGG